jgi:hypothetical protein
MLHRLRVKFQDGETANLLHHTERPVVKLFFLLSEHGGLSPERYLGDFNFLR